MGLRERPRGDDRPAQRSGLRIFVAAYPTPLVVHTLAAAAEALGLPAHRPTPVAQVHLTLLFVGDTDPRRLDDLIESVERATAGIGGFTLELDRLATLPERGPARLVAAFAPPVSPLDELQGRLAARLTRPAEKKKRSRPFLPHLTLLRFRSPVPRLKIDDPIDPLSFPIDRIAVMKSVLRSGGAQHSMLAEVML